MVGEQSASYHAAHHYQRDFLHKFIFYVVYSSSFYSSLQIYDFFSYLQEFSDKITLKSAE